MGDWYSLNPNELIPSSVLAAAQGVTSLVSEVIQAAELTLSTLPSLPAAPSVPNPSSAVASQLLGALSALTSGVKLNVLVVPIQKTFPNQPSPLLPATASDLQNWTGNNAPVSTDASSAYQHLVSSSANVSGGNAGFYKAFVNSLLDMTNANRPSFVKTTDAVTAAVIMVGDPSFYNTVQGASGLNQLMRPKADLTARTIPIPQNVTATPAAGPSGSTAADVSIVINWDPPSTSYGPQYFPGVTFSVNRYAIIRSTDVTVRSARSVLDLFPTQALTAGMTSGNNTVVAVGTGTNSTYADTGLDPDEEGPLYYSVAWEVNITEQSSTGPTTSLVGFDKLSAFVSVDPSAPPPVVSGSSANWGSTSPGQSLFPQVGSTVTQLSQQIQYLQAGAPSTATLMQNAMNTAKASANQLSAGAAALTTQVQNLQASLQRPLPSMYVTRITGTGGNTFLTTEFARRLQESDPNRPPFDHNEYVCGIVVMAGGPTSASISNASALLDALFGPATPANPLIAILDALGTTVTNAETVMFGPNMQPLPTGTAPVVTPVLPVINAAGAPVAGDDPTNPNIDFTNDTPLESLC